MKFKHYIFDLDGTLVKTKEIHNQVFNDTLEFFGQKKIKDSDLPKFDGLPSSKKLELYNEMFYKGKVGIEVEEFLEEKQKRSEDILAATDFYDEEILSIFRKISKSGAEISVATNCTKESATIILESMQVMFFINTLAHNKSAAPKPSPDLYNLCIKKSRISAANTVIIEDNKKGLFAALESSDDVCVIKVADPTQLKKLFI